MNKLLRHLDKILSNSLKLRDNYRFKEGANHTLIIVNDRIISSAQQLPVDFTNII